jgi:hypothetical protein
MTEKRQAKLYQFVPSLDGKMLPEILLVLGKPNDRRPDGTVDPTPTITLKASDGALQYYIPDDSPHIKELTQRMEALCEKKCRLYGEGKPGSVVEIPLTRKVKGEDVSNLGHVLDEYLPKTDLQKLQERNAELEAKAKDSGAKDEKLAEQDKYIKDLLAQLKSSKASAKSADKKTPNKEG